MINLQKKKPTRKHFIYFCTIAFRGTEITDNALAVLIKKIYIPAREKEERKKKCVT